MLYSNEPSRVASSSAAGPSSTHPHVATKHADSDDDSESDNEASSSRTPLKANTESASIFAQSFIGNAPLGDISIAERARKNSRRDVEQQLIGSSVRFLNAFGDVNDVSIRAIAKATINARRLPFYGSAAHPFIYQKLDALQEHVDDMRSRCDEAQAELAKTSEACRVLLEKAGGLRSQRCASEI